MDVYQLLEEKVKSGEIKVYDISLILSSHLNKSKSQINRLISEGAVKINNYKIYDKYAILLDEDIISIGKRKWLKWKGETYKFKI